MYVVIRMYTYRHLSTLCDKGCLQTPSLFSRSTGMRHCDLTETVYLFYPGTEVKVEGGNVKLLLDVLRYILELLPSARDKDRLLSSVMGTWRDYLAALYDDTDPMETGEVTVVVPTDVGVLPGAREPLQVVRRSKLNHATSVQCLNVESFIGLVTQGSFILCSLMAVHTYIRRITVSFHKSIIPWSTQTCQCML